MKKYLEAIFVFAATILLLTAMLSVQGCRSATTVYEYDDTGKVLQKKVVTDESALKSIMLEMKDKNVAWGINGWGHISLLKDVDVAKVIHEIMIPGLHINTKTVEVGNRQNE